jgi:uncharacterized protein
MGMTTRKTFTNFIQQHSVLTYFLLTFIISWGGVLILGAPYGMPATSEQAAKHWPTVFLTYFFGPSLASLLLIISRLLRWRVGTRWYGVALLTAPLLVTVLLLVLSLASPVFLPGIVTTTNRMGLILTGLVVGLVFGGFMEELGWTGFAVPGLRQRHSLVTTGLIVGVLHALWHFLPTFWASGNSAGAFDLLLFLPPCVFYLGVLPAYRVLMVWVYDRTQSLLVALLMHTALTATTLFILAPLATGVSLMIYYLILTVVMWVVVAVVALANGGQFSRQPLQRQMA